MGNSKKDKMRLRVRSKTQPMRVLIKEGPRKTKRVSLKKRSAIIFRIMVAALIPITNQNYHQIPGTEGFLVQSIYLHKPSPTSLETTLFVAATFPKVTHIYKLEYDKTKDQWRPRRVDNIRQRTWNTAKTIIFLRNGKYVEIIKDEKENLNIFDDELGYQVFSMNTLLTGEAELIEDYKGNLNHLPDGFASNISPLELTLMEYRAIQPYFLNENEFILIGRILVKMVVKADKIEPEYYTKMPINGLCHIGDYELAFQDKPEGSASENDFGYLRCSTNLYVS